MTHDEALSVVMAAAEAWAAEIGNYIIPGGEPEDQWQPQIEEIEQALRILGEKEAA